jgi:hypothetical protein
MERQVRNIFPVGVNKDGVKLLEALATYSVSIPTNKSTRECMAHSFAMAVIKTFADYEDGISVEVISSNLMKSAEEWRNTKKTVKRLQASIKMESK